MKTFNKIFIAAIAAASMTACNNELSEQTLQNGGNVNFTMGIGSTPSSRVSMEETGYTASFTANDAVGIFVNEVQSYTNVKYSTADGTTWTGGPINVSADGTYTYYAYYPYAEDMTANNIAAVVATNQDTNGYIKNDYLYSKLAATPGQTNVNLTFNHALSLVEVTLAGEGAAAGAAVELLNVVTDATIDLTAEKVTAGTTKAAVTMDALNGLKYRAIVPAQSIAASTPIFRISVNGKVYQAKYASEMKFEQGKYLAMTITLGGQGGDDAQITITTSASINDWSEGTSNGGQAEIEEVPLISEFGETISAMGTNDIVNLENSSWFSILASDGSTAEVKAVETAGSIVPEWTKQADLTFISTSKDGGSGNTNSWYNTVLGYFYKGAIYTGDTFKYKLSFRAKGDVKVGEELTVSDTEKAKIYVVCRNAANDASFAIINNATSDPTATNSTKDLTGEWADYAFYVYFDKKLSGSPTSLGNKQWETTGAGDYQNIQIRISTTGTQATADATPKQVDLSITDVKLEPYIAE